MPPPAEGGGVRHRGPSDTLLTRALRRPRPQGWSSAYSIESVIMQISATLVKGKARVQFGANKVSRPAPAARAQGRGPEASGWSAGRAVGPWSPGRGSWGGSRGLWGAAVEGGGRRAAAGRADGGVLSQSQYSLTRAQQSYKSLVQIHEKNGEARARGSHFPPQQGPLPWVSKPLPPITRRLPPSRCSPQSPHSPPPPFSGEGPEGVASTPLPRRSTARPAHGCRPS